MPYFMECSMAILAMFFAGWQPVPQAYAKDMVVLESALQTRAI